MFSGKQEEFSEFKTQFRELCQGERYTPVLELAQMKLKLPREALAAISGLRCPDEAWLRLEELYGNRELSIMSALKTLRDFKTTKSAPHEQVIELAMTVQKCKTELSNVDAIHEMTGDRESIACIVHALPQTIRDKWYDWEVPSDTTKKGEYLMTWLEHQRQNAIRVRMDTMAVKLRGGGNTTASKPNPPAGGGDSTDKGLISSALHAQGAQRPKSEIEPSPPGPRIEVKTRARRATSGGEAAEEPPRKEAGQVSSVWPAALLRANLGQHDASGQSETGLYTPDILQHVYGVGSGGEAGCRFGKRWRACTALPGTTPHTSFLAARPQIGSPSVRCWLLVWCVVGSTVGGTTMTARRGQPTRWWQQRLPTRQDSTKCTRSPPFQCKDRQVRITRRAC